MSILNGILAEDEKRISREELEKSDLVTARYASGPAAFWTKDNLAMSLRPYLSDERSAMDATPLADTHRNALCFDGRLDNYRELASQFGLDAEQVSNSELALRAFLRWGERCFDQFKGDWAIALWSESKRHLYLARDHAGARTLYFTRSKGEIRWSTYLDVFARHNPSEEYAARYLSQVPLLGVTPYEGISAVLPGHYVRFAGGEVSKHRHWTALIHDTIRYRNEGEYEEQFLWLFRQAVLRRTRAGAPILAELSGGMDSTSIVCMSDRIRRSASPSAPILDTISYFDDTEVSFDERSYFATTERLRGKTGIHVNLRLRSRTFEPHDAEKGLYLFPGADKLAFEQEQRIHGLVWNRGFRSVLSGIGGDEVLGGLPSGTPELADYLVSFRWVRLYKQALSWSLVDRTPLFLTLARTLNHSLKAYGIQKVEYPDAPSWIPGHLTASLLHTKRTLYSELFCGCGMPSKLDNAMSWWSIMETLPHLSPRILHRLEYRYPYLDKDLVQYLFSIPRTQILRPGRRRSLMRRALADIVPSRILERRRKAFQSNAPLSALRQANDSVRDLFTQSAQIIQRGWVDGEKLRNGLDRVTRGDARDWPGLMRAISLELWLRSRDNAPRLQRSGPSDAMESTISTVR